MRSFFTVLVFCILGLTAIKAQPVSGTKSIGPGGDYTTLTAAFSAIAANGLGGAVVLSLNAAYTSASESFPLFPPSNATAVNTITVRPSVSGLSITSNNAGPTFDLAGTVYFTVDGRVNGLGSNKDLVVWNTNTSGTAFRFINGASNNTLMYCVIRGVNNSVSSGVVFFSTASATSGNNNNLIEYCDIRDGASTPVNGICSAGTLGLDNTGIILSNNNIYNFYRAAGEMAGVLLSDNSKDWLVSGNSFYQTAARNITENYFLIGIACTGTRNGNITITGNYIGGQAPLCGGGPLTITGAGGFKGMRIGLNQSALSDIQGNYIRNISITTSYGSSALAGISIVAGSSVCGNTSPNYVGDAGNPSGISLSCSGNAIFSGINTTTGSLADVLISNNIIAGITMGGSGGAGLRGIYITGAPNSLSITGNTIGFPAAPLTSACNQILAGIYTAASTLVQDISNNNISYLNATGTGTSNRLLGIYSNTAIATYQIVSNTIRNLSSSSTNVGTATNAGLVGIFCAGTSAGQQLSNNTVHSLVNTGAVAHTVTGILYYCPAGNTNVVSGNSIHSLAIASNSAILNGIYITGGSAGSTRLYNNMIRLGIKADGSSQTESAAIYGLNKTSAAAGHIAAFFNSIYIGGNNVANSATKTRAFYRAGTSSDTVMNNLFVNSRSDLSAGVNGNHFAYYWTNTTNDYQDYNIYHAPGTNGVLTTLNNLIPPVNTLQLIWEGLAGQDLHSGIGNPNFVNPAGNASLVDLHLQANTPAEGAGLAIAGIEADKDGDARAAFSPVDLGADAGNYTNTDIFHPVITFTDFSNGAVLATRNVGEVYITDQGSGVNNTPGSRPRLYFKKNSDLNIIDYTNTTGADGWKWVEANNTSSPYDFSIQYIYLKDGGVAVGDVIQYFVVAQDQATPIHLGFNPLQGTSGTTVGNLGSLPTPPKSFDIVASISGTLTVGGAGADYPNFTGSTGLFQAINSRVVTGDITAIVAGDLAEPGVNALNQWAENDVPYHFSLSIQADGVALRTIANSGPLTNIFMIRFNGADRVTIDGGAGKNLLFRNTHTTAASARSPIQFLGGARECLLTRCIVETNSSFAACVNLGSLPANEITVDQCDLRGATAGTPGPAKQGIYSNFTGNALIATNNNIYNWSEQGIWLMACADNCQITGNSFYNTLGASQSQAAIKVEGQTGGHDISGNYIGGSEPQCGGTPYVNSTVDSWFGIQLNQTSPLTTRIDNNTIRNIQLTTVTYGGFYGIMCSNGTYHVGSLAGNTVGHPSVANAVQSGGSNTSFGIWLSGSNWQSKVENNLVANITMTNPVNAGYLTGIHTSSSLVGRNMVYSLGGSVPGASLSVVGIYLVSQDGSANEVVNNMVSINGGSTSDPNLNGLSLTGSTNATVRFSYNSVRIFGSAGSSNISSAFYRTNPVPVELKNNLLINERGSGVPGMQVAIGSQTPAAFISDHNVLYSANQTLAYWNATVYPSFAAWKAVSSQDINSVAVLPVFLSATDLHLVPANNCFIDGTGTPLTGLTLDYDGITRDAVSPDPGFSEFSAPSLSAPVSGGDQEGCEGGSIPVLSASGAGTVKWYSDLALTNLVFRGNSFNTGQSASGTYTYYALDSITGCESPAIPVQLSIFPPSLGGAVTPGATVCSGENSGLLSLSGHTGTIGKWQFAVDPFVSWTDIAHTGLDYISGPLTGTTHFRAVVRSGPCTEAFSSPAIILVNPLPLVGFGGTLAPNCISSTDYLLSGGTPAGGTYSGPGVTGLNFDASVAGLGTHQITYTYTDLNYCTSSATNSIQVNDLPAVTFTGELGGHCLNDAPFALSGGSPPGGAYTGPGVSGGLFTPLDAGNGTHVLTYTFTDANACSNSGNNSILVHDLPQVFVLSGSGSYCQGSGGLTISLGGSENGVDYQLVKDGMDEGPAVSGTGGLLTWPGMTAGTYTVVATYLLTGCSGNMNGTVVLTENPLPQVFDVSGTATYCYGEEGSSVFLSSSESGVSYQLLKDGISEGSPVLGSGGLLSWDDMLAGTYTVLATVISTSCATLMSGSATLTEDPAFTVTITPDPAYVIFSQDLDLEAVASGGTPPYSNHLWTGSGASSLSATNIADPVFNNPLEGDYLLTYQVSDGHACTAMASLSVHVTSSVTPPLMASQIRCGAGSLVMTADIGSGGDEVQFSLDGINPVFTDNTAPYEYSSPVVSVGSPLLIYARTRNSLSSLTSVWISASATAYETSVGGTLSGSGVVCLGQQSPQMTLLAQVGDIVQWHKRVDGGSWVPIANTLAQYQETPVAAGTWEYRAEVQIPACASVYSTMATVQVDPVSAGGSVNGPQAMICSGSTTGALVLSGHTGAVVQWQRRFNGLSWQNISYTTASYSEIPSSPGVWDYRAEVRSGNCASAFSTHFTVTVDPPSQGGSVSGGSTLCPGVTTGTLVLSGHTGLVVQWQRSLGGGSWTNITHTQTTYAEVPGASGTWEYRARVKNGSCPAVPSLPTTVVVLPASVGGSVMGGSTICLNSPTGDLSLLGYTNTIIRWEKSLNGGSWLTIPHTQDLFSEVPASAGTWQYRAVTRVADCEEAYSMPATVEVLPLSSGGTVAGSATVCQGAGSGPLELTGYTGAIQRWQYAVSPFSDWINIAHASPVYSSGPLSQTTRYRAVVKNGVCAEVYSSFATITVPSLPEVSFDASLPGQCLNNPAYTLSGGVPSGGTYSGPGVSGTSFYPSVAGLGTHNLTYTYTDVYGCSVAAYNSITVNPLPLVTFLGTLDPQCETATTYLLSGGLPENGTYSGPGVFINIFNASEIGIGNHSITYTYTDGNGCLSSATNTISVIANPQVFTLSGSGAYCEGGSGLSVVLNGSETGIRYQLYLNGSPYGVFKNGTGGALTWTPLLQGTYTAIAERITPNCYSAMAGEVVLTENPRPQLYVLGGNAYYCYSSSGTTITLSGSESGISYQLKKSGLNQGAPLAGNGSSLSWPNMTNATYTIVATNPLTTCFRQMSGSLSPVRDPLLLANISPDPLYVIYGNDVSLNGNPAGGTTPFSQHAWSGPAAAYLSTTALSDPVFNSPDVGNHLLTYTVTDGHGCTASDQLTVHVTSEVAEPVMPDKTRCGSGSLSMEAFIGSGGDQVQFSLDGATVALTDNTSPYIFLTPPVSAGSSLEVLARTRNGASGLSSQWISAHAHAFVSSIGGQASGGLPVCLGDSTAMLSLAGQTGEVIGWQKSLDGGSWSNIALTDTLLKDLPASAGNWEYRAQVQIPGCDPVYSASTSVLVYSPSNGGTLTGGFSAICLGASTATMSLSGHTGTVLSWRKRLNAGVWQSIPHTGSSYSEIPVQAGSWDYEAEVGNGSCPAVYSGTRTILVDVPATGGVVSGNATLCPAVSTPDMTLNAYAGSIVKWQRRLITGSWTDIAHTAPVYSEIPPGSGSWQYRAVVQAGSCNVSYSAANSITVIAQAIGGSVSGDTAICLGSASKLMQVSGHSGSILRWQKRLNAGTWIDLPSAQATFQEIPSSPGTWQYRAVLAQGSCPEVYSSAATVEVSLPAAGGIVGPDLLVCSGENSGLLGLTGHFGEVQRWQSAVAPFTQWDDIPNTLTTYTSGPLTQTTRFRAIVKNEVCQEVSSAYAEIGVIPPPEVTYNAVYPVQCLNAPAIPLSGGLPEGGTYSGNGVTDNIFYPVQAGTGVHAITYTVETGVGCNGSAGISIEVTTSAVVSLNLQFDALCLDGLPLALSGGLPSGGSYSGNGVINNEFHPSLAGVGTHAITYVYLDEFGCGGLAQASISVHPLPQIWSVGGSAAYCEGAGGLPVTLSSSQTGVNYQLFRNGNPYGSVIPGTGTSLSWEGLTEGVYTASATVALTACQAGMDGSATLTINPLPLVFPVSGSGSYCHDGLGLPLYLEGSQTGVSYQLFKNGLAWGDPLEGIGAPLQWTDQEEGSYNILATNIFTACGREMEGLVTLVRDPLLSAGLAPVPAYCAAFSALEIQGSQWGGTPPYAAGSFSGAAAAFLSAVTGSTVTFSNAPAGNYPLIYTLIDNHGCQASANLTVQVVPALGLALVEDTLRCGGGPLYLQAAPGANGDQVQFSDDSLVVAYTATAPPYQYLIPELPGGSVVTRYARTRSSLYGLVSPWKAVQVAATTGPFPGAVSGDAVLCLGQATGQMQLTNYIGYIQQWQKRLNGGAWIGIPQSAAFYSEVPVQAGSWEYRVEVALAGCPNAFSGAAGVLVHPPAAGGTIQNVPVSLCLGSSTGMMNLNAYTGDILFWRKRLNGTAWQQINFTGSSYSEIPSATGTWEYQAAVQSGTCPLAYSPVVAISVNPLSQGGTVSGGASICQGSYTPLLSLGNHLGNVLSWQKRVNNGSWVNIIHTAATYSEIPVSPGTWQYRALVQNASCNTEYSSPATVTVVSAAAGGQLNGGGNICLGSSTGYLVLSAYSGSIVKWQRKFGNGDWTDISFQNNQYSTVLPTPGMWYFRVLVNNAVCGDAYSTTAQVYVTPPTAGGSVGGGSAVCQGSYSGPLVLSGQAGSVVKWQKRLNGGAWTDITHVNTTLNTLMTTPGTWDYRAVVQNGACSQQASAYTTVQVSSATVAGNLSGGSAFCLGNATGTLQLTNYNGTIVKWQKRHNGGSWVDIANQGTTYAETPAIAGSWEYRAMVQSGSCPLLPSTTATVTVNAQPQAFTLGGPGMYCEGVNGVTLALSGSETGVAYQLRKNGLDLGFPVQGNGQALQWHNLGNGTYTVHATHAQSYCSAAMPGSVAVSAMPLPQLYTLEASGYDCGGNGNGLITLEGSDPGVLYLLSNNGMPAALPQYGDGGNLWWENLGEGSYTILATNPGSGCSRTMNGTGTISLAPLPLAFGMSGGGEACANGNGMPVSLDGSEQGVEYQLLYNGQALPGQLVAGTGQTLPFGIFNQAGFYQVEARQQATSCTSLMEGSVWINLLESPEAFAGPDMSSLFGTGITLSGNISGGSPPYTILWSPATGLNNTAILSPFANPADTVTYTLQVTDANGCVATDEVVVSPFLPAGQSVVFGTVTYDNTAASPLNNVNVQLRTLAGQLYLQTTTNSDGSYQFPAFPSGTYLLTAASSQPVGGINSTDGLETLKHFVHLITLQGIRLKAADVDGSGYVNAVDALAIQRRFVGLLPAFPAGAWVFETKQHTYTDDIYVFNLKGLCYGDVNASFNPNLMMKNTLLMPVYQLIPTLNGLKQSGFSPWRFIMKDGM